jgi:predicted ATP-dependent protease
VLKKIEADAAISVPEKLFKVVMEFQAKASLVKQINQRKKLGHDITEPSKEEMDQLGKEMAGQQLDFLLQQELVKREGTNISSQAKLGDGLLSVNGKTVPLR